MKNSKVAGIAHYLPERVVTNRELEKMMDTSDEWIQERTGIKTRRWITEGETVHGMALKASNLALERAGMSAGDIDFIVFASMMGDHLFPGGGCFLQEKMGLPGIPALDIRNGCSGFIYGLAVADQFIKTGTYRTVLVVGAEIQSTSLDLSTRGRDMAVIFADGAGAVVLSATGEPDKGVLTTHLHADGQYATKLWLELPATCHNPRMSRELFDHPGIYPSMEGRFVFKHAVVRFPEVVMEALAATHLSVKDIDLFIPHQANLRITEAVARRLEIPMEKVVSNIQTYGNTTSASIPIAMSESWEEGRIQEGSLVCLASFGAGFTWASALIRF